MTTFLDNRFAFFFMRRDRSEGGKDSQGYASSINKIGAFDSVQGFFGIYDHLGITPTWEDPHNKRGGKWIIRLRKVENLASLYFEELLLALIGEQFGDVGVHVCGVVVSVRQHEDIIAVWNSDAEDKDATNKIRDVIKSALDLPNFITLEYKRHQFHRQAAAAAGTARATRGDRDRATAGRPAGPARARPRGRARAPQRPRLVHARSERAAGRPRPPPDAQQAFSSAVDPATASPATQRVTSKSETARERAAADVDGARVQRAEERGREHGREPPLQVAFRSATGSRRPDSWTAPSRWR
ncbi:hypothetical protein JL721_5134 [Aureococcus anophagefferens]|nr:hypothetical protein JL721_5134 [Aureococcus anophagefferens]